MSIYVASKSKMGPEWKRWREAGIPIISTWIDECGPGESNLPALWTRCIQEVSSAQVLVLVHNEGEVQKGSLVEMGAALTSGASVIWVGPEYLSAQHHPLVHHAQNVDVAMAMAMTSVVRAAPLRFDRRCWNTRTYEIVGRFIAKQALGMHIMSLHLSEANDVLMSYTSYTNGPETPANPEPAK
jgi:hypothetical protein